MNRQSADLLFLKVQDGLLAEIDHDLPFVRHEICFLKFGHFVQDFEPVVRMRTQEVVIRYPQAEIRVGSVYPIETIGGTIGSFVSPVQALNELLVGAELFCYRIFIRESDDLGDLKLHLFTELMKELLGSQRISTVTVGDEAEAFRQLVLQVTESRPHGFDTGSDSPGLGGSITDDRAADRIHDEPDVGFDAADLDIGLIRDERGAWMVVVMVHKRLDADGSSLAVVCDLLTGNRKPVQFLQGLRGLSQGELKIYMPGEAETHDVGIVLTETQG